MTGVSEINPFVGPRPIQQGEVLYGRAAEVHELYNQLQARRIVVLHSPSGAGKSSMVAAGLIPRLKDGNYDVWKPIRVNLDPTGLEGVPDGTNRYLLSAMVSLEDELPVGRRHGPDALAKLDLLEYLESRPRRKNRENRPVVLLFDQFEEVLTVAPRMLEAKREFFAALGRALDTERYWALFIIREDYLGALAPYRDRIPTQMANTFRLDLLNLRDAREVAVRLAEQGGRSFPAVDQLIRDLSAVQVQQPDGSFVVEQGVHVEPVQLQVVCRRLWEAMPQDDRSIDPEDIEKYGEVSKSLAGYYADAIAKIAAGNPKVERAIREWVGQKLVVGGIRSQVRQETGRSAGLENPIIQQLLDVYLVRNEQRAGSNWFELSHDRLVEPVLQDNRAWEQTHLHPLQVQAKAWETGKRTPVLLLGSGALPGAIAWADENAALMTDAEREFLELSRERRAEEEKKLARDRVTRMRLAVLAGVAGVSAIVMGVMAVWALRQRDAAELARDDAERAWHRAQQAEKTTEKVRNVSMVGYAKKLLALEQPGLAAMVLAEVKTPEATQEWTDVARTVSKKPIPWSTRRHVGKVESAAWSPDGKRFVTVADDDEIRVWNSDGSGDPIVLDAHWAKVVSAAWSPDGKQIVTASHDDTARVWNADGSGTPIVLAAHWAEVVSAAWSPDGKQIVTASRDQTARVWNADGSGEPIVFVGHEDWVVSAAWSPDGKQIVTASHDDTARVWNADGSGKPSILDGHSGDVSSTAWSPDGEHIVTTSSDGTARVWNTNGSGEIILEGHSARVVSAAWSPDSKRIVTATSDGMARVWNADGTGTPIDLEGHSAKVQSATWSPDATRIVTASVDGTARVWNADGSGTPVIFEGHSAQVVSAAWSPDAKRIVTASHDRTARVWNIDDSPGSTILGSHADWVVSAAWSHDAERIVTAEGNEARVWSVEGSNDPITFAGHSDKVMSAAWSPDAKHIVTASQDGTARIWNVDSAEFVDILGSHSTAVMSAAWSPDAERIVTTSGNNAWVWKADGAADPVILEGHSDVVSSAVWTPNAKRIVTASADGTARIWNADGSGTPIILEGHSDAVLSARWSPDSKHVVTASQDQTARVWDVEGATDPIILEGHSAGVQSATWSPNAQRIVTASQDQTARVWRADGSGEPFLLEGHSAAVLSAAWSPDATHIVTTSRDKTVRIWPVDLDLRAALREATTDCLDPEQRENYLVESQADAYTGYAACERRHDRTPVPPAPVRRSDSGSIRDEVDVGTAGDTPQMTSFVARKWVTKVEATREGPLEVGSTCELWIGPNDAAEQNCRMVLDCQESGRWIRYHGNDISGYGTCEIADGQVVRVVDDQDNRSDGLFVFESRVDRPWVLFGDRFAEPGRALLLRFEGPGEPAVHPSQVKPPELVRRDPRSIDEAEVQAAALALEPLAASVGFELPQTD